MFAQPGVGCLYLPNPAVGLREFHSITNPEETIAFSDAEPTDWGTTTCRVAALLDGHCKVYRESEWRSRLQPAFGDYAAAKAGDPADSNPKAR